MAVYKWKAADENEHGSRGGKNGRKLRAAAYCRVSTDDQESSYEEQCRHYQEYIAAKKDWDLVGIYADEGISGTGMRKRKEFLHLLRDCENGMIDIVITKSVSRFARNTVDMLVSLRKLRQWGIRVIFEKENLDSAQAADEFLLTFWASFAQAESVSIAQNVVKALQTRMARGEGRVNCSRAIGYRKAANGTGLEIVPEEAAVIRRIYRSYLEGKSTYVIAEELMQDQVPACLGAVRWYASTVSSILSNEKNMGNVLFQKTFTADTLTHRIERNRGQLPKYYVTDHHEPIIPKEIFYRVQGERIRRAGVQKSPEQHFYGFRDALKGRVICGICGRSLKKVTFPDGQICWQCRNRAYRHRTDSRENSRPCKCRPVSDQEVRGALLRALRMLPEYSQQIETLEKNLETEDFRRIRQELADLAAGEQSEETITSQIMLYAEIASYHREMLFLHNLRRIGEKARVIREGVSGGDRKADARADIIGSGRTGVRRAETADEWKAGTDTSVFLDLTDDLPDLREDFIEDPVINRFVHEIIIRPDGYEIILKGGLRIRV